MSGYSGEGTGAVKWPLIGQMFALGQSIVKFYGPDKVREINTDGSPVADDKGGHWTGGPGHWTAPVGPEDGGRTASSPEMILL